MTIEESVKKDPQGFRDILDIRTKDIKDALNDLSAKLDGIIGGAIREYGEKAGTEVDINSIPSYKTNGFFPGPARPVTGRRLWEANQDGSVWEKGICQFFLSGR